MKIKWPKFNRSIHHWGAIICALPVLIVLITGVLLTLKKELPWVQPATVKTAGGVPTLTMPEILSAVKAVPDINFQSWDDIERLDVRPAKGVIKVRGHNHWEVQLEHTSGEVLQVAYRRSDVIEALHDGSFFHDFAKLGVFLPSALILFVLWLTGLYLFATTHLAKRRSRLKRQAKS